DDVAEAAWRTIRDPSMAGRVFELGGPEALSLRQIIERILGRMGRQRLLLPIPYPLARLLARFAEALPAAPLTLAQVELLEDDNVPAPGMPGVQELGIDPRQLDEAIAQLALRS